MRHRLAFGWLVGVTGLFYVVPQVAPGLDGNVRAAPGRMVGSPFCSSHGCYLVSAVGSSSARSEDYRSIRASTRRWGTLVSIRHLANWLEFWEQGPQPLLTDLSRYQLIGGLVGGFYYPLLFAGLVGIVVARPRRQQWYAAVLAAGLGAGVVASQITTAPFTPRYIYWVYPALYLAAAEGVWFLGRWVGEAVTQWRSRNSEDRGRERTNLDCARRSSDTRPLSGCRQSC